MNLHPGNRVVPCERTDGRTDVHEASSGVSQYYERTQTETFTSFRTSSFYDVLSESVGTRTIRRKLLEVDEDMIFLLSLVKGT